MPSCGSFTNFVYAGTIPSWSYGGVNTLTITSTNPLTGSAGTVCLTGARVMPTYDRCTFRTRTFQDCSSPVCDCKAANTNCPFAALDPGGNAVRMNGLAWTAAGGAGGGAGTLFYSEGTRIHAVPLGFSDGLPNPNTASAPYAISRSVVTDLAATDGSGFLPNPDQCEASIATGNSILSLAADPFYSDLYVEARDQGLAAPMPGCLPRGPAQEVLMVRFDEAASGRASSRNLHDVYAFDLIGLQPGGMPTPPAVFTDEGRLNAATSVHVGRAGPLFQNVASYTDMPTLP
jgi:hypothetical protein